jgi:cobalt-zinc-cadmium efflux system membrane fusion protein
VKPATLVLPVLWLPVLLLAAGCRPAPDSGQAAPTGGERPRLFTVAPAQLGELRLTPVETATWTAEIQTTGTVDWDADHTTQAITQVSGPISRILADLGHRVAAGDPLLYVSSSDLANAFSSYRKASNRLDLSKRTLDRDTDLLAHHVIAPKDVEAAQADYNDAFTEVQNDLQALRIFGITAREIDEAQRQNVPVRSEMAVRSPIGGLVVQKLVLPGQLVQAGATTCFLISETSTVWVQGHLHDEDLGSVRVGDAVDVRAPGTLAPLRGTVGYIGAMLDPATRTTPVRVVTANPGGVLKKDQFVDLVVHTSARREVLTVPTSAVLYTGENLPVVYRQVQPGRFARTPIQVGAQRGGRFEVVSGLRVGDTIVAEGGVFLQFAETDERQP